MLPESPIFCDWQSEGRKAERVGGFLNALAPLRQKIETFHAKALRRAALFFPETDDEAELPDTLRDDARFKQLARRMNLRS